MEKETYLKLWLQEEEQAHIHGWDFSHINGKYEEEQDLPWNYRETVRYYLKPEQKLLDVETGGGEFLLSLNHPCCNLAATENYPPNVELCRKKLLPMGIDFQEADGGGRLPFPDESFDLIINRHGNFNPAETARLLKKGGIFITEQVGAENFFWLFRNDVKGQAAELPYVFCRQGTAVLRRESTFLQNNN